MSYDISLVDRKTGETATLGDPFYIRGGNVRAAFDPATGGLRQIKETEAHINVTYNYSRYYVNAAEGDERFLKLNPKTGEHENLGIRAIYGMSCRDSLPMLMDLASRITEKYKGPDGEWLMSERKRTRYYDADGQEIADPLAVLLHNEDAVYTEKIEVYTVSEGDTSNYWESTAANAIRPLMDMVLMAVDCLLKDCVWTGD